MKWKEQYSNQWQMSGSNPPKKHHYIPAFYTKRWRQSDGRVIKWSTPYKSIKPRSVHPEGTGYIERLYEMRGFSPDLAQQIEEEFFKPVDNGASEALLRLEKYGAAGKWSSHSRSAWSRFLVSLQMRCPEDVELFRRHWPTDYVRASEESEAPYAARRGEGAPETLAELLTQTPAAEMEEMTMTMFAEMMDLPNVGNAINQMQWRVFDTSSYQYKLLTSDRPIVRSVSITGAEGYLALPIGPTKLFVGTSTRSFLAEMSGWPMRDLVRAINSSVVREAVKYVYSSDQSQGSFIERHFETKRFERIMEIMVRARMAKNE